MKKIEICKHKNLAMGGSLGHPIAEMVWSRCDKCGFRNMDLEQPMFKQIFTQDEVKDITRRINQFHLNCNNRNNKKTRIKDFINEYKYSITIGISAGLAIGVLIKKLFLESW